jgi:Virulence activator alpha C-term
VFSRDEVLAFLNNLSDALAAFTAQLEQYAAVPQAGDRHPRLALDHGLAVHRASLEWAGRAIAALRPAPTASS